MQKKAWVVVCLIGILMLACSLSSPPEATPEPRPSGPVNITLSPNGGGEYESLVAAVAGVPAGSAIRLEAGVFRVEQPLLIDKEISLIGAGMELTQLVFTAGDYGIKFDGRAPFRAYDLTFSYEGTLPGDVVVVKSGEVLFNNCRFIGARTVENDEVYRAGLALVGSISGNVQNCEFANSPYGIGVQMDADYPILLEGNKLHNNTYAGIKFFNQSGGTARNNEIYENGYSGIILVGEAAPLLENNKLHHNTESGIVFFDNTSGTARGNECFANGYTGISVANSARVVVEGNICTENSDHGIGVWDSATALIKGNTCSRNGLQGIMAEGQSQVELVENTLSGNTKSGIVFFNSSGGVARGNTSTGNGLQGIALEDQAEATLENNTCSNNTESGIIFLGTAGGRVTGNECANNGLDGIFIDKDANPTLENNNCYGNGQKDVNKRE